MSDHWSPSITEMEQLEMNEDDPLLVDMETQDVPKYPLSEEEERRRIEKELLLADIRSDDVDPESANSPIWQLLKRHQQWHNEFDRFNLVVGESPLQLASREELDRRRRAVEPSAAAAGYKLQDEIDWECSEDNVGTSQSDKNAFPQRRWGFNTFDPIQEDPYEHLHEMEPDFLNDRFIEDDTESDEELLGGSYVTLNEKGQDEAEVFLSYSDEDEPRRESYADRLLRLATTAAEKFLPMLRR